jgi:hypothetical protein
MLESRLGFAQPDQGLVPLPENLVVTGLFQLPIQLGAQESLFSLGIRRLSLPGKGTELAAASLAHRFHQVGIPVADKIQKWRHFPILFPHK